MSKLLRQNIGGVDFTITGCALTGVCASAASDYTKVVTLSDGDVLADGMTVSVTFANGNTAGTAPASLTIYSSDQTNYYSDAGLTVPFTLAPAGCYEIEYTGEGNAYTYISFPVMQAGGVTGPLCNATGQKASGSLWLAGDKVSVMYKDGSFVVIPQAADSLTVMASSSSVVGAPIRVGSTVRVLFTADLAGADTTTGLVLTYNGVPLSVKVNKNGALGAFTATDVGSGTYKYLQAYTTLEMVYDGTQLIVLGNPAVISNADYTVYTDGYTTYTKNKVDTIADTRQIVFKLVNEVIDLNEQYNDVLRFTGRWDNFVNAPSINDYTKAEGVTISVDILGNNRTARNQTVQICYITGYKTSMWYTDIYARFLVDNTWFSWTKIHTF